MAFSDYSPCVSTGKNRAKFCYRVHEESAQVNIVSAYSETMSCIREQQLL